MKKLFKILSLTVLTAAAVIFAGVKYISCILPDTYTVFENENLSFNMFPFSITASNDTTNCTNQTLHETPTIHCVAQLKLLNILPIKTVCVNTVPRHSVTPCGTPFGVKIYTRGVMVIGISNVWSEGSSGSPGKECGLKRGDVITHANQSAIKSNEELDQIIQNSEGQKINISVSRNGKMFETELRPAKSSQDGKYRAGIWVRDSSAGIGTLTFCDKTTGSFAGLGHGICDVDTGEILPLENGELVEATISDVQKGCKGSPGELKGCFVDSQTIGKIHSNSETGLYGTVASKCGDEESMEVAMKQHVKKGPAQIITTTEGTTAKKYNINIDCVNYNVNMPTKNIKISVTDDDLLKKTGGIVQGMSGSPIIQEGMLVGAITHVFVNDPTKGYAIFAETMLTNSNRVFECQYKKTA